MIRNHDAPAEVVDFIIGKVDAKDPVLFQALDQYDGSVEQMIGDRLGGWAILPTNTTYLNALGSVWQEKAAAAGIIDDGSGDDAGDDANSVQAGP
jgi:hypothetical protein